MKHDASFVTFCHSVLNLVGVITESLGGECDCAEVKKKMLTGKELVS